ncbi:hypothetical protein ONZ43_g3777 [Nemania bipapillata]|uniref:Uncharacterized protein n=1 Tax=Nemania bipapillata TaxID=110536 RepID=A0ACC2IVP5_9PEZI|nr:hypothetical protein ONZ43_g3777 [Nemania bipapillata]
MRFEDWDVLLFPKDSKVPMKEFKTNCHVVHDSEFAYTNGSYGLPTMTCFMPNLPPGTGFNISLHSWKTPDISQFTRNYSKHPELVKFEARVLVDGRLVATSSFNRNGPWPQLIDHSFEFTKNGDLEVLKFPQFRSELLRQSYWSPADEVGRIKIVISEGFPRDSLTVPIERVKNIVAFSFQHAPLDILESSGIAWPNPAMWRRGPFNPTMPTPSHQHEDGPEAHLHSPRRHSSFAKSTTGASGYHPATVNASQMNANNFIGNMPNTQSLLQRGINGSQVGYIDPFNPSKADMPSYFDWSNTFGVVGNTQVADVGKGKAASRRVNTHSKISASDTSMPDYSSSNSTGAQLMTDFQPMGFVVAHIDEPDTKNLGPKVPANTPTTMAETSFVDELGLDISKLGTPGTPEIKSRKENRLNHEAFIEANLDHIDMLPDGRIGSGSDKGIKRTRQFTPASAKAIDDEDEPRRGSPRVRNGAGEHTIETN